MAFTIDLGGQRALVSGAGQGVGRAIALALAEGGAAVAVNDVVVPRAQAVVEEIARAGGTAEAVGFDVTDWEQVSTALGGRPVDILVNNAGNAGTEGFSGLQPFAESDPAEWDRFIRVNLYGVMHCTRAVLPGMIERGHGRVVTIVSDAARYGDANLAPYAAAKAGAAGLCRSIAREVGRHGITVNCIALGTMRTPATERPDQDEDSEEIRRRVRRYIVPRRGVPEDVTGMVVYLASPLASWVTGQTYPVNGGYSLSL